MDQAAAERDLLDWMVGANALALLRGIEAGPGLTAALGDWTAPEDFADRSGVDPSHALRILVALAALGVADRRDGRYRLTEGWAAIAGPDRPAALADRLGFLAPVRRGLEGCLSGPAPFDEVDPAESEALARSVSGVATSPEALASWAALDARMPQVRAVWEGGGRHAEFGCGAGRDLVRVAAMYPGVRAVGYDILDNVLVHARALAERAGVADRVDLRLADILTLDESDAYDTLLWSHMFFPPGPIRDGAVASATRALKPGGYLIIPFMADLPAPDAAPDTPQARFLLTVAVAYRRWDIHWPGADELRAEMEARGFRHLVTIPHPRTPFMALQLPE